MTEKTDSDHRCGAVKHDKGKIRHSLIPWEPLHRLAEVYTIGAAKYGDDNWRKGMPYSRILDALKRHLYAWEVIHEDTDPEDGQHHLASVAWCAFTLMYYEMYGAGDDDRPVRPILVLPVEVPVEGPVVSTKPRTPRGVERDTHIDKRERIVKVLTEAGSALPSAWELAQAADVSHGLAVRTLQVWHPDIDIAAFVRLGPRHFQRRMAKATK